MKAAVYTKYGPPEVIKITEIDKPGFNDDEVLIKVHYATVNRTDTGFRSAKYFVSRVVTGLIKPKRIVGGSEFAGEVVAAGKDVKNFEIGDKVFGFEDVKAGGHAEYVAHSATGSIAKIPAGFTFEQVAPAGEGATYALSAIWAAQVKSGQKVMVYGATGSIGSAAVQILKHMGAEVTAVCGTKNVELIKSFGLKRVIDYQTEDFTKVDDKFDFIFDAVGKSTLGACRQILKPTGKYCSSELGPWGQNIFFALWYALNGSRRVIFPIPKINQQTINQVQTLLKKGVYKPIIDKVYPLEDIVSATKYVETGKKIGNVVIKII